MADNPVSGLGYFIRGFKLLFKPGVKRYVLIPLIINIILFAGLFGVAGIYFGDLIDYMMSFLPEWLSFLSYLFWLLFVVAGAIIVFFGFSFLANVVGAPFNGALAAAVEKHLTGQYPQGSERPVVKEVGVAMLSELRKWGYYLMFAVPLFIITLFPLVTPFSPFIWFIFGAWMYSLEYAEYPMGNYGLSFPQVRQKVRTKRVLSLSFGSIITLATMVPLLNFFVMPVSVAAATAMRVEQFPLAAIEEHGKT